MNYVQISLIVMGVLLGIVLIAVIIWRILDDKKTPSNKTFKQFTTKATFEELNLLNSLLNEVYIFENILVKNTFSKNNFSVFPGIILTKEKIFLTTNVLEKEKNVSQIIVDEEGFKINKKNKIHKIDSINWKWIKSNQKWMEKYFSNVEIETIILTNSIERQNIKNSTSFRILNIYDLEKEIKNQNNEYKLNLYKATEIIKKHNQFNKGNK